MSWNPEEDGITHVNVYSNGRTLLGRLLSNFAHTPFSAFGQPFQSVEGFWYWVMTGDQEVAQLYGYEAKRFGKTLKRVRDEPNLFELKTAYSAKLQAHPKIHEMLKECTLPLAHYYVWNGHRDPAKRVVEPKGFQWTVGLWEEFR